MKCIVAIVLALSPLVAHCGSGENSCRVWAQAIIAGDQDACSDLCPQAIKFDQYDYRKGLAAAFKTEKGLDGFLLYLNRSSIIGSGAEAHACSVRALLEHWGDQAFAKTLRRQKVHAREQAIGLIDYTALANFQNKYPQTYKLASHE